MRARARKRERDKQPARESERVLGHERERVGERSTCVYLCMCGCQKELLHHGSAKMSSYCVTTILNEKSDLFLEKAILRWALLHKTTIN